MSGEQEEAGDPKGRSKHLLRTRRVTRPGGAGPIGPPNPRPEGGYIRHSRDSGSAPRVDVYLPTYKRLSRGGRRKEAESGRRRREEGGVG